MKRILYIQHPWDVEAEGSQQRIDIINDYFKVLVEGLQESELSEVVRSRDVLRPYSAIVISEGSGRVLSYLMIEALVAAEEIHTPIYLLVGDQLFNLTKITLRKTKFSIDPSYNEKSFVFIQDFAYYPTTPSENGVALREVQVLY